MVYKLQKNTNHTQNQQRQLINISQKKNKEQQLNALQRFNITQNSTRIFLNNQ